MSDLHFEKGYHHDVFEFGAFQWLLRLVKRTKPTALVGLGDWGYAWTMENWQQLTSTVPVHALYGNHDDLSTLQIVKNRDGSNILATDGEIRTIENTKFGFINGIIAEDKKVKEGIARKTSKEFLECAMKLVGVDVLCTHESPYLPDYEGRIHRSVGNLTVVEAIELVKPKLAISGHLSGPYTASEIGTSTAIRVESSQTEKHYAIIRVDENNVTIWNDGKLTKSVSVRFDA